MLSINDQQHMNWKLTKQLGITSRVCCFRGRVTSNSSFMTQLNLGIHELLSDKVKAPHALIICLLKRFIFHKCTSTASVYWVKVGAGYLRGLLSGWFSLLPKLQALTPPWEKRRIFGEWGQLMTSRLSHKHLPKAELLGAGGAWSL